MTANADSLNACIRCGGCTALCPTADQMAASPQRVLRLVRLCLREEALRTRSFWLCTSCNACSSQCPRGVPVLETMLGLKRYAVGHGREVPENLVLLRETRACET